MAGRFHAEWHEILADPRTILLIASLWTPFRPCPHYAMSFDQITAEVTARDVIPPTRKGRYYRSILTCVLVAAIIGIADQVRDLFWLLLTKEVSDMPRILLLLPGWGIMAWCGYRAYRKNRLAPAWAIATLPVLLWAYLLLAV